MRVILPSSLHVAPQMEFSFDVFRLNISFEVFTSPMRGTCFTHLILDLIIKIFDKD
jgi:hypothetical protein